MRNSYKVRTRILTDHLRKFRRLYDSQYYTCRMCIVFADDGNNRMHKQRYIYILIGVFFAVLVGVILYFKLVR